MSVAVALLQVANNCLEQFVMVFVWLLYVNLELYVSVKLIDFVL